MSSNTDSPTGWPAFAIASAMAIIIALLTVSYESIRAAVANPVESLKDA